MQAAGPKSAGLRVARPLHKTGGVFSAEYELCEEVGRGSYSVCYRCVHRNTRVECAVKIVNRSKRECEEEVQILLRYGQVTRGTL